VRYAQGSQDEPRFLGLHSARRLAKWATAALLGGIAAFLAWYGSFIISKVFDEYKDSSDATYLSIGGVALAISALFAITALLVVSKTHHPRGWLVVAVLALVAAALPYVSILGSAGLVLNGVLALLAAGSALAYLTGGRQG